MGYKPNSDRPYNAAHSSAPTSEGSDPVSSFPQEEGNITGTNRAEPRLQLKKDRQALLNEERYVSGLIC